MPTPSLPPDTPEQALITHFNGAKLVVIAFAGTGKTTTLIKYALANPNLRILYVAFNRAIRDEAKAKFPKNVECLTSHQLAYAEYGKRYRHKQKNNLRLLDIGNALSSRNWAMIKDVQGTLNTFLASAEDGVRIGHTPRTSTPESLTEDQHAYKVLLVDHATKVWELMCDVENDFPMTHDGYLKLYQLSKPMLAHRYSAILFDEAQDANPVTSNVILSQPCIVIFVGDRHQQIYRFRGADNALDIAQMDDAKRLYLTNSFRFGPKVAMVANAILGFKGEERKLIGRGGQDDVGMALPPGLAHRAVLHRTVMATIATAMEAAFAGEKIYWIGGIEGYQLDAIHDLYWLSEQKQAKVKNQTFTKEFKSFQEYKSMAKASNSGEMLRAIALVEGYEDMPGLISKMRSLTVGDEREATITVGTAHKSKGLEWDYVALADDFPDVFQLRHDPAALNDELNLLYVACTRAMRFLSVNATVESILRYQFSLATQQT